ncbi:MAG: FliI/YscN family ATPase [Deltaproteobacteria bacterium]|nr:FliI/YscN family ATPase [Deltaproteobacteria bacterium]
MGLVDLDSIRETLSQVESVVLAGKVTRATGLVVHATLPRVSLGTACDIFVGKDEPIRAEVVGFEGSSALLMPVGEVQGIREGARVVPRGNASQVRVHDGLLGRVVDANLEPIDDLGALDNDVGERVPLHRTPPNAMRRKRIERPLTTGVRVLDSLLTLGEGQRVGIMAGAGVGKSVLLGMLARSAEADIIIVGLIGERGREVREFVERDLGPEGLARSIVVVATGDTSPLVRVRAALAATAAAEHYRDEGKKVLLLMDSLTRVSMAHREIGLAAGEPPTSKGYPPSVFTALPKLVERSGMGEINAGSITAVYTVLVEGDDLSDPIADAARAALDGHWILSRDLAGAGQFPAVDVLQSVSRVMNDIADDTHLELSRNARAVLAVHKEARDLLDVGAYVAGSNAKIDHAIAHIDKLNAVLRQSPNDVTPFDMAKHKLMEALL